MTPPLQKTVLLLSAIVVFIPGTILAKGHQVPGNKVPVDRAQPVITKANTKFGPFIEGTSPDVNGNMYAVNFGGNKDPHTLGQFYPAQQLLYRDGVPKTRFNGMRFVSPTKALAADKVNHRIVMLDVSHNNGRNLQVTHTSVLCQNPSIIQPNDIAISRTGTIFLSSWREGQYDKDVGNGDIWSCTPDGQAHKLEVLGRTNGVELSPDERYLYVTESNYQRMKPFKQRIWIYNVDVVRGTISNKRLFVDFQALDHTGHINLDGVRTDTEGNVYAVRYGGSEVTVFNPRGKLIRRIKLSFPNPTNLDFGGPYGKTLFIVGECATKGFGCADKIETHKVGRAWAELQKTRTPPHGGRPQSPPQRRRRRSSGSSSSESDESPQDLYLAETMVTLSQDAL